MVGSDGYCVRCPRARQPPRSAECSCRRGARGRCRKPLKRHAPTCYGRCMVESGRERHATLLDRRPALVGIEPLHLLERLERCGAEVLFVDHAVVADDEGLDASDAILRGGRGQREAADHHFVYDEVELSKRCRGSLSLQDLEVVPTVGLSAVGIAALDRCCHVLSDGTVPGTVRLPPCEPILRTGRA